MTAIRNIRPRCDRGMQRGLFWQIAKLRDELRRVREAVAMKQSPHNPSNRAAKYDHIDFTPPAGVRAEAAKGLAWRREHGRGGTEVGIARARDLSNGKKISPETAKRMKAFFDRHQTNKGKDGWSPGDSKFPSNARIAWALWGSDAGWSWAKKLVRQMEAADSGK